jgi:hypothetical protein
LIRCRSFQASVARQASIVGRFAMILASRDRVPLSMSAKPLSESQRENSSL